MIQQIVRVSAPEGLNPSYPFHAATLKDYNLSVVSESEWNRYKPHYIKLKRFALRLPKVVFSELDVRKVAAAFKYEEVKIVGGNKSFLFFWGLRNGETERFEVPVDRLYKYHLKKPQPAFVYREESVLCWHDNDRIAQFFRAAAGSCWEILPFEYFQVTARIVKSWNVVFPDQPIPPPDPEQPSGLYYYESF